MGVESELKTVSVLDTSERDIVRKEKGGANEKNQMKEEKMI